MSNLDGTPRHRIIAYEGKLESNHFTYGTLHRGSNLDILKGSECDVNGLSPVV